MAKTAIQLLVDTINRFPELGTKDWILGQCEEVKHEEKQQIMDAWIAGREFGCKHDDPKTAEEYYNRTYKSE